MEVLTLQDTVKERVIQIHTIIETDIPIVVHIANITTNTEAHIIGVKVTIPRKNIHIQIVIPQIIIRKAAVVSGIGLKIRHTHHQIVLNHIIKTDHMVTILPLKVILQVQDLINPILQKVIKHTLQVVHILGQDQVQVHLQAFHTPLPPLTLPLHHLIQALKRENNSTPI